MPTKIDPRTILHVTVEPDPEDASVLVMTAALTNDVGACVAAQRVSGHGPTVRIPRTAYDAAHARWRARPSLDHHPHVHMYLEALEGK